MAEQPTRHPKTEIQTNLGFTIMQGSVFSKKFVMPLAIMKVPDTTVEKTGSTRTGKLGSLEESFITSSLWCRMIQAGTHVIIRMKFQMMVSPANMLKHLMAVMLEM